MASEKYFNNKMKQIDFLKGAIKAGNLEKVREILKKDPSLVNSELSNNMLPLEYSEKLKYNDISEYLCCFMESASQDEGVFAMEQPVEDKKLGTEAYFNLAVEAIHNNAAKKFEAICLQGGTKLLNHKDSAGKKLQDYIKASVNLELHDVFAKISGISFNSPVSLRFKGPSPSSFKPSSPKTKAYVKPDILSSSYSNFIEQPEAKKIGSAMVKSLSADG